MLKKLIYYLLKERFMTEYRSVVAKCATFDQLFLPKKVCTDEKNGFLMEFVKLNSFLGTPII